MHLPSIEPTSSKASQPESDDESDDKEEIVCFVCFLQSTLKNWQEDLSRLYCLCRKPYTKGQFMIQCDACSEWFVYLRV